MSKSEKSPCPTCGKEYQRLGQHWSMGCVHPEITERMEEIIQGLMLGDGTIHHPPSAKNVQLQVSGINKTFIEWLSNEFDWLSNGWSMKLTSDEVRSSSGFNDRNSEYNIRDQYLMTTRRHPGLNWLKDWYSEGRAEIIEGIELTPLSLSVWYASDGCLFWGDGSHANPSLSISSEQAVKHPGRVEEMFEPIDVEPYLESRRILFNVADTKTVFDYLGDPLPGFDYKYVTTTRSDYKRTKEQFYEDHTTTTTNES